MMTVHKPRLVHWPKIRIEADRRARERPAGGGVTEYLPARPLQLRGRGVRRRPLDLLEHLLRTRIARGGCGRRRPRRALLELRLEPCDLLVSKLQLRLMS